MLAPLDVPPSSLCAVRIGSQRVILDECDASLRSSRRRRRKELVGDGHRRSLSNGQAYDMNSTFYRYAVTLPELQDLDDAA